MSRKLLFVLPLLALGIGGCDSGRQPIPITERRALSESDQQVTLGATSKERFAMVRQMMGMQEEEDHSGHNHPPGEHGSHAQAENAPLVYELPDGWKKEEETQFRTLNFSFGEGGECYVSRVGGTLEANLNRWRGQMGLEPVLPEDIGALPKRLLFGMESTYIELDGAFKGVGAAEVKPLISPSFVARSLAAPLRVTQIPVKIRQAAEMRAKFGFMSYILRNINY